MLTLKYDDGGVQRSLTLAIDSLKDLKPIFGRYIKWLRPEIDKVFAAQGPGWAPLAESTQDARKQRLEAVAEKLRSGAMRTLDRKLSAESGRVLRKLEKRQRLMDRSERGQKLLARAEKSAARQRMIREEFARLSGGQQGPATREAAAATKKLGERIGRRQARAEEKIAAFERGDVLGAIASSIGYEVQGSTLTVFSHIKWAGAHNDGATVGHGARVPERKFLEWTPERIAKLAEIAAQYVTEKVKK